MLECVSWDPEALGTCYIYTKHVDVHKCLLYNSLPDADGIGDWTTDGCNLTDVLFPDVAVCECNHLSNFGVLVVRVLGYSTLNVLHVLVRMKEFLYYTFLS